MQIINLMANMTVPEDTGMGYVAWIIILVVFCLLAYWAGYNEGKRK